MRALGSEGGSCEAVLRMLLRIASWSVMRHERMVLKMTLVATVIPDTARGIGYLQACSPSSGVASAERLYVSRHGYYRAGPTSSMLPSSLAIANAVLRVHVPTSAHDLHNRHSHPHAPRRNPQHPGPRQLREEPYWVLCTSSRHMHNQKGGGFDWRVESTPTS